MTLKLVTTVFLLGLFTMMPPADAANVSKDQALSIAQKVLAEDTTHDLVILKDKTVERPFGWVFFYALRQYAEQRSSRWDAQHDLALRRRRQRDRADVAGR